MDSRLVFRRHVQTIRLWLLAIAGLIFLMVLVGGATRLTESGLSMVEWRPVSGVLPPLSPPDWQREFEKYQAIPQYRLLNPAMKLDEFKTIYWWEWAHRMLGRLIGAAFLLPFAYFLWRGWIGPGLRARLWGIFGFGALQGAIGWWMVASGLADRTEVSQYRLAIHLVLACVIFAATLWTAQALIARPAVAALRRDRAGARGLLILVLVQIYFGALLAGLRGGLVYNTWPLIDGAFVPSVSELFPAHPLWRNLFENILTVQFAHRTIAYALWLAAVLHVLDLARARNFAAPFTSALALAIGVSLQAGLGVLVLLYQVPVPLALLHQAMATIVLALAVVHAERLVRASAERNFGAAAALPSTS
jgi:cytochrome c oxidase assembly protein subunit 15